MIRTYSCSLTWQGRQSQFRICNLKSYTQTVDGYWFLEKESGHIDNGTEYFNMFWDYYLNINQHLQVIIIWKNINGWKHKHRLCQTVTDINYLTSICLSWLFQMIPFVKKVIYICNTILLDGWWVTAEISQLIHEFTQN